MLGHARNLPGIADEPAFEIACADLGMELNRKR
jgi:hypothetical protein